MYDHFLAVLFHATGEQLTDEEVDQRYRWHSCASIISNTSLNKLNFTCDGKDYSYSVLDVDVCCSLLLWRCPCCCGDVCCWPVNSRSASSTMRFSGGHSGKSIPKRPPVVSNTGLDPELAVRSPVHQGPVVSTLGWRDVRKTQVSAEEAQFFLRFYNTESLKVLCSV